MSQVSKRCVLDFPESKHIFLKQLDRSIWLKAQPNRTLNNTSTASPHAPHIYLSKRRLRRPIAAMLQTRVTFAVQSDPFQNNASAKTFSFSPGATLPAPVLRSVSNLRRRLQYAPQGQVQAAGKSVAPNHSLAPSREEHNQRQAHLFADAVERLGNVPKQVLQVSPSMLIVSNATGVSTVSTRQVNIRWW